MLWQDQDLPDWLPALERVQASQLPLESPECPFSPDSSAEHSGLRRSEVKPTDRAWRIRFQAQPLPPEALGGGGAGPLPEEGDPAARRQGGRGPPPGTPSLSWLSLWWPVWGGLSGSWGRGGGGGGGENASPGRAL